MKRYTLKLAIAFIISYVLLMLVVVFAYTQISRNFIYNQARKNLITSGTVIAERIDQQLDFDYGKVQDLILYLESITIDPLAYLEANYESVTILDDHYLGFGLLNERTLTLGTETYTYVPTFDLDDFDQKVSFYSFQEAFGEGSEDDYIFFKFDDIIGYFDANTYLASILDEKAFESSYFMMSQDNAILYSSNDETKNFFYDILRSEGMSESDIDKIKDDVMANEAFVIESSYLDVSSFMTFNPLSSTHSIKQFYIIQIYNRDLIIDSMAYLTNILWALFFVIFILFAGAMVLLYKILENKMNDIENARITHYYAKPYIVRVTSRGKIKSYNQSFRKLLGDYDIYDDVKDFNIKKEFDMEVIEDVIRRQRAFTAMFELGMHRMVYIRFIPVRSQGGYLLIGDDISNIEGRFDEYRNLALFNKVTHLPNYNSLKQDLQAFFEDKTMLEKKNALLALDVVSFSKINLLLGEKSGDRFLVIISELIDEALEGYPATLYNTSADSFVIFFKDIENYNWITRWINKIVAIFEKPITIDRNFINSDLRMGIFYIEKDRYEILNPDVAYDNMNLALNHAKESSSHKYFIYDVSLSLVASREQRMETDLAQAIKNQEFYMVLQPKFDNDVEQIVGFEALVRWNNPKYQSESPLKFIEMAEKNNMIIDIGRIVLHETFQIAKEFEPYNVKIAVNVSPVQLLQAGFVNEIISIFEQYELKKHSIAIEITETFLIGSFDLVINKLKLLQKYGFDIHLDDFGTGYSSLQYLKDLPISTIKIDRAFVMDIETDAHSRAIVTMIASLAKTVGLGVVAEGIETDRQNQIAYKSGCNIIQGYLISPPVVKQEAAKLIRAYNIEKTKHVNLNKQVKTREVRK